MWRYSLIGGVGGLAPICCQGLALFLPNLVGGSDKYSQALALLPHTAQQWLVALIVLSVVFLIAAFVVTATMTEDASRTIGKAFLIGVSVPSMIVSLANGASNGMPSGTPSKPKIQASTITLRLHGNQIDASRFDPRWPQPISYQSDGAHVDNIDFVDLNQKATARLVVTCPECPSSVNPSALITVVTIRTGVISFSQATVRLADYSNDNGWFPLPLKGNPTHVTIGIPDKSDHPPNEYIDNMDGSMNDDTTFKCKVGQRWTVNVTLKPGAFNNVFAFLGRTSLYSVDSISATLTTSS